MAPALRDPGALPPALQPWRPWLQWFEPDLAAQLGLLVQRLHPLLGVFRGRRLGGDPEPDGVDDLRVRGPYERLLASEWLLAEDLPDEFLRRAAMGEHLFLTPRPRARQAERLIVALFDAGPLQLGAPRLAHLALWILLARRALSAGGELRWGVLQEPGLLHEADGVQQMLRSRSFVPGHAGHWGRWGEVLAAQAAPAAECWFIGSDLPPRTAMASTHQVRIRRHLQGDALDVMLREGGAERVVCVPLPPATIAAALLKGRIDGAAMPARHCQHAQRVSLQRAPLFSPRGHLVAVPLLDEPGMAIFPLPRVQDHKTGAPRRQQWAAGTEPLAVCFGGKQIAAVLCDATQLFFWHLRGLAAQPRPPREAFHAPPARATWLAAAWLRHHGSQRLCVIDQSGRLVSWQMAGPASDGEVQGVLTPQDRAVCGLVQYQPGSLVYARATPSHLELCWLHASGSVARCVLLGQAPPDAVVRFAGGALWASSLGGCAVCLGTAPHESWRIHQPVDAGRSFGPTSPLFEAFDLQLPPGWQAAGLVHDLQTGSYALMVLAPDRQKLYRLNQQHQECLFTAPAPVLKCSVCPNTGLVAMLTGQRHLIVYDPSERAVRLFVHTVAQGESGADA